MNRSPSTQRRPGAGAAVARLLAALEEFTGQQAIWLRSGNCARALAVQRRAAPLIARLAELRNDPALATLRPRLGQLLARRRQNLSVLANRRTALEAERQRLVGARERLRNLRHYARASAESTRQRLQATV